MVTTLNELYQKHRSTFKLQLLAGKLHGQNIVDWIYMLEDETLISHMHGGFLIVTTAVRQVQNPHWLYELVEKLITARAAGLIVNTGMYVNTIPGDLIELCRERNFPLITMPWEMLITEMTQTLCMNIINNQQETLLHDRAIYDAIIHPENEETYRERLSAYYDLDGDFTVINVYAKDIATEGTDFFLMPKEMIYRLERTIRSRMLKATGLNPTKTRISWIQLERMQVFLINHTESDTVSILVDIIREIYSRLRNTHHVYISTGTKELGVVGLSESYRNALTALRLAEIKNIPTINFQDMGLQRILLSCRNDTIPKKYADELLAPIDAMTSKSEEYLQLLDAYIRHDRSLEKTAEELFLHRNTVNYRIKKLKELLNNPLKTVDDLVPFRVALSIRNIGQ